MRLIGMSITDVASRLPTTAVAVEQLPDNAALLKSMLAEAVATLQQERRAHEAARHRLDLLLQRLYGPRGERYDPNQPLLFPELSDQASPEAAAATTTSPQKNKRRCRPHGRRRMPADLPREVRHHELTAAERLCPACGQKRLD